MSRATHTNSVCAKGSSPYQSARAASGERASPRLSPRALFHDQSQVHAGFRELAPAHGERAHGIGAVRRAMISSRKVVSPDLALFDCMPSSLTGRGLRAPGLFSQGIGHRLRANAGFGLNIQTVEQRLTNLINPSPGHSHASIRVRANRTGDREHGFPENWAFRHDD